MPEKEFDLYLSLLSRLLRLSPEQKASIDNELRDHLEARFEELVRKGLPRDEAIQRALDEFGDAAGLAQEFTRLSRRNVRRWIMRCTLATAAMGAVVLLVVNAFLPEQRGVPVAQNVVAQDGAATTPSADATPAVAEGDVVRIDPAEFLPAQLSQPIDIELVEVPLHDAMQLISERIGAPVFFDEKALADEGIRKDQPISETASGEPAYLVLDRMLWNVEHHPLAWHWADDILHITTPEEYEERLATVSYNVRDLLLAGHRIDQLSTAVQQMTDGPWLEADGMGGTLSEFRDLLVVRQKQSTHREVAALLQALTIKGRERRVLEPAIHQELRRKLATKVTVDFVDAPLSDAVAHINATEGPILRLDARRLADEGVSGDVNVTLALADRPLQTVLKYLLNDIHDVQCSIVILDGAVWVTTRELAEQVLSTVVYDVGDIVGGDTERSTALLEVIENQTSGPWVHLDGIGGELVAPVPDVIAVRQTEWVQAEVSNLLAEHRAAMTSAVVQGQPEEFEARLHQALETRYYQMDAETADDLLTVLPETVAPGTWASTVGSDGKPVPLNANGIGTIRVVAAGRKVHPLGGQSAPQAQDDPTQSGSKDKIPAGSNETSPRVDVLVVPQSVLIITHKRSVHRQIRDFLQKLEQGSTENFGASGGFGGFIGGIGGGGGGLGGAGGGFFSVTTPE